MDWLKVKALNSSPSTEKKISLFSAKYVNMVQDHESKLSLIVCSTAEKVI
jgi:hypothetical protein